MYSEHNGKRFAACSLRWLPLLALLFAACDPEVVEKCRATDAGDDTGSGTDTHDIDTAPAESDDSDTDPATTDSDTGPACVCGDASCGVDAACSSWQGLACTCGLTCGEELADSFGVWASYADHFFCYELCNPAPPEVCSGPADACFALGSSDAGVCLRKGGVEGARFAVKVLPAGISAAITDVTAIDVAGTLGEDGFVFTQSYGLIYENGSGSVVVLSLSDGGYTMSLQIAIPMELYQPGELVIDPDAGQAQFSIQLFRGGPMSGGSGWMNDAVAVRGRLVLAATPSIVDCWGPGCPLAEIAALDLDLAGFAFAPQASGGE